MTALTTSVRMEGSVWMASILTTAAAPLSGPVGAGHVADESGYRVHDTTGCLAIRVSGAWLPFPGLWWGSPVIPCPL